MPLILNPSEKYEEGKVYYINIEKDRNWPQHKLLMCLIRDAWESLDDETKRREQLTSPDVLRKKLLIATGYRDLHSFTCDNDSDFQKIMNILTQSANENTFISVSSVDKMRVIVVAVAHSQRMTEMDENTFKESVRKIQEELARGLGCHVDDVRQHVAELASKKRLLTARKSS